MDTDTEGTDRGTLFTPGNHRSALDPNVTVVKGARGVGKTYWFKSLMDTELRELAADEYNLPRLRNLEPLAEFSIHADTDKYPGKRTLARFLEDRVAPFDIWTTIGLVAIGVPELTGMDWTQRVAWLCTNPEAAEQAQERADKEADAKKLRGCSSLTLSNICTVSGRSPMS